jgi:bacteriocin biosynthesis cyclodehydratase domain-containing protein
VSVGLSLQELLPHVDVSEYSGTALKREPEWPAGRMYILASWRPVPRLIESLNAMCHATRTPLLPAIVDGYQLVVGPVIVPGLSACHRCYELRIRQHYARQEARAALNAHYDLHPESGPKGHLRVFADLAAIRLAQLVQKLDRAPKEAAGNVWRLDLLTRQAVSGRVIGVHGCRYCGMQRDEQSRSHGLLEEELAFLFKKDEPMVEAEASVMEQFI